MWKSIDSAPRDRDIAVICANGHVCRAWWHKTDGITWKFSPFEGWVSGDWMLTGRSEPILYAEIPSDMISTSGQTQSEDVFQES